MMLKNLHKTGFLSIIEHVKLPSMPELKLFENVPNYVCEANTIDYKHSLSCVYEVSTIWLEDQLDYWLWNCYVTLKLKSLIY